MAKNILVLGMARSGTSMTTAIFSRKGYYVAKDEHNQLQKADKFNPSGYWEAKGILKSNKEILAAVGYQHDNTWFHEPISEEQSNNIHTLPVLKSHEKLVSNYNSNQPWIWKDPRLCYTLGYWWPLLNQENTRVLLLKRDPDEIYKSFLRVKDSWYTSIPKDEVYARIQLHIDVAEKTLHRYNIPYTEIHYSDYKNSPEKVAKKLSLNFEVQLNKYDIGYRDSANHSSLIGKLSLLPEKILNNSFKSILKNIFK